MRRFGDHTQYVINRRKHFLTQFDLCLAFGLVNVSNSRAYYHRLRELVLTDTVRSMLISLVVKPSGVIGEEIEWINKKA